MDGAYQTVFEVSCFSNGGLNMDLGFLFTGIGFLVVGFILPWFSRRMNWNPVRTSQKRFAFVYVFGPFFIFVGGLMVYFDVSNGCKFTSELANNQCDFVEGIVQVLHEQPSGGHDPEGGDRIRIGDKEFVYSAWTWTLSYNKTISHGGELRNGVVARLHYIGNNILKVEIKQ
jgi:hypothetical protein